MVNGLLIHQSQNNSVLTYYPAVKRNLDEFKYCSIPPGGDNMCSGMAELVDAMSRTQPMLFACR
jgi:hypothetical protein